VVFAVGAAVLCRSGFEWVRRDLGSYDLWRINHVLRRVAVGTLAMGAAVGVATLVVEPPRIFRRENPLRLFLFWKEKGNGDGEAAQVVHVGV
jgi:hypothetical protein